jgi:hypothetical protein
MFFNGVFYKVRRLKDVACVKNCTRITIECKSILKDLISLFNTVIKCPLEYYKCHGNLVTKDHLVSGYYSGQNVIRDESSGCNHGGLLDVDSMSGGINKVNLGLYIIGKRHQLS